MMEPAHINSLNVLHSATALIRGSVVYMSDADVTVKFLVEPN